MANYVKGMQQVAKYNHNENQLWFTVIDKLGRAAKPDAAPNITITNPSGSELVASTAMTAYAGTTSGYLLYDAQTSEFSVGATLTGGTSAATALIVGQQRTGSSTGVLELADINGTFQNNETITDNGEYTGSATENLILFQSDYSYTLDTTTVANYPIGKNYCAKILYDLSTIGQAELVYFDVAYFPATSPWVTSSDVATRYPSLQGQLPDQWEDWAPAIQAAHADLVRKLHALGEQAAHFVKRREEMWGIEMVLTRLEISRAIGEDLEKIEYWEGQAASAWSGRGEFTFDSNQDDTEIDDDVRVVSSGLTR